MKFERFNEIVHNRMQHCKKLLVDKGEEYSRNGDRLHNFKTSAGIDGTTPESELWGYWKKHIVSVKDMIDDAERGIVPSAKMLDDKLSDMINYTLLLEGLFTERMMQSTSAITEKLTTFNLVNSKVGASVEELRKALEELPNGAVSTFNEIGEEIAHENEVIPSTVKEEFLHKVEEIEKTN